jgi:hypothetical protein
MSPVLFSSLPTWSARSSLSARSVDLASALTAAAAPDDERLAALVSRTRAEREEEAIPKRMSSDGQEGGRTTRAGPRGLARSHVDPPTPSARRFASSRARDLSSAALPAAILTCAVCTVPVRTNQHRGRSTVVRTCPLCAARARVVVPRSLLPPLRRPRVVDPLARSSRDAFLRSIVMVSLALDTSLARAPFADVVLSFVYLSRVLSFVCRDSHFSSVDWLAATLSL